MSTLANAIALALQYHHRGALAEAEQLYRQVLQVDPRNADALHFLGVLASQQGRHDVAVGFLAEAARQAPDNPTVYFNLAIVRRAQGSAAQAAEDLRQALRFRPDWVEALNNLGDVLRELGSWVEALATLDEALRLNPDFAEAHTNRGDVLRELGRPEEALASLEQALRLNPDSAGAHNNLGALLSELDRAEEALACYRKAIDLDPTLATAHDNLGCLLRKSGKVDEAMVCHREALRLNPRFADAYNNLGDLLWTRREHREALSYFQEAVRLDPGSARAHNNLALALEEEGRVEEALAHVEQALRLNPELVEATHTLGIVLNAQDKLDEALDCFQQAIRRRPDYAIAHNNRGIILLNQGRVEEAKTAFEQALEALPDYPLAHLNRGTTLLLQGHLEQAWPEYEWRRRCKGFEDPSAKLHDWDGSDLAGKAIVLHAEQGMGDTIQFIRYAALVKRRGGSVVTICPASLVPLLVGCPGIDQLVTVSTPVDARNTVQALLLSLPGIFGTTLDAVPVDVPYLTVDPARLDFWRGELAAYEGFKIGIVWQGSRAHTGDPRRSVPLAQFAPLAGVKGVRLFSLQVGAGQEQLQQISGRFAVIDLGSRFDAHSILDAAAAVQNLDLIVTVDTAVAHLAGALGKAVWVALPLAPDWRWMLEREDTPWYPSMRLFRQKERGKWEEVFERIAGELSRLTG